MLGDGDPNHPGMNEKNRDDFALFADEIQSGDDVPIAPAPVAPYFLLGYGPRLHGSSIRPSRDSAHRGKKDGSSGGNFGES